MSFGPISTETIQHSVGYFGNGFLHQRLDTIGDGSGTKDMATSADEYFIFAQSNERMIINKLQIVIEDDGILTWDSFAALGAALTNGLRLRIGSGNASTFSVVQDLTDDDPITINSDLLQLGEVAMSESATGRSILTCMIDIKKMMGVTLELDGRTRHGISLLVQDDLSSLERMQVHAYGVVGSV